MEQEHIYTSHTRKQGQLKIKDIKKNRKPYNKPRLRIMGSIQSLTLGPTPGRGESGNPAVYLGLP